LPDSSIIIIIIIPQSSPIPAAQSHRISPVNRNRHLPVDSQIQKLPKGHCIRRHNGKKALQRNQEYKLISAMNNEKLCDWGDQPRINFFLSNEIAARVIFPECRSPLGQLFIG
jgi:hypothetical protein